MLSQELIATFDQQASSYDARWTRMAPIREGLSFVLESVFADLSTDARHR
jgi:tRNA (cmo5U34)-methyltransferase